MSPPEGLLLVDKPEGPTSHDVVALVKRRLAASKVGHAGTLDPMASGLLPLALGRATRLIRFLPAAPKVYAGSIRLGLATTTDDVTGEALSRHDGPAPPLAEVIAAAARFSGRLLQHPPAFSARRVSGQRMYRLARRGEAAVGPPVEVEVYRFDLAATGDPWSFAFTVAVSSGTYVRSLARDLGAALGCGGTLETLRRTAIGPFRVEDAVAIAGDAALDPARIVPLEGMPLGLPDAALDDAAASRFASGVAIPWDQGEGLLRVTAPGRLVGVGEVRNGLLAPRVVVC
ncbi:MAG TPA: tRNA pseudouridine(55) synthase TruB [Candidatus Polarisedimenticolaceae bacterium]